MKSIINNIIEQFNEHVGLWTSTIISYIPSILLSAVVLVVSVWMSGWLKKKTRAIADKYLKDSSMATLLSSIVSGATILISLVLILMIMDLDEALTSILATAGVIGLAVGMALQDPMINTFSGITMSIRNFYNIGDWISTNGIEGKIEKIKLRWTELQKPSGEKIFIPNKMIVSNPVENFSISGRRQIQINCGISYDSDLKRVKQLVLGTIVDRFSYVEKKEDIIFFYHTFGDSSINFTMRFWIDTQSMLEYNINKSEAMIAIKSAFDKNDVNIPFPTRTLNFNLEEIPEIQGAMQDQPPHESIQPGRSTPQQRPFWNNDLGTMKA